ncbi:hypothetical protein ACHAWF_017077, partial [Thalassiosira exigua]
MQLSALVLVAALATGSAFAPANVASPAPRATAAKKSVQLYAIDASLVNVNDMAVSRAAFALCFFGAAGSAAIGRAVIPKIWDKYWDVQSLVGAGTAIGGREIDLFGYPEPVYENDVLKIIGNNMTIPEIVESFPIENQIPGYLRYESLAQANPDVQPMAVRAVFDSMALGINKNQVAPRVAVQRLEAYKADLDQMTKELSKAQAVGLSALIILLTLIGAADYFSIYHLYHGWFPTWPGLEDLPSSLFAGDTGLAAIPNYWLNDIPEQVQSAPGAFPIRRLVVSDGVEEVVVARVEHGVHHAARDAQHGAATVLDLDVERAVAGVGVLDLAGVAPGDEGRGSVVPGGEVLGTSGVLPGGHGDRLGEEAEEGDLGEAEGGHVAEGGEAHAVVQHGAEGDLSGEVEGSGEGDAE